ncbi:E3 ubiquitin-protein ligase TRIM71-like [Actinia tenebrosa]|uniref:E3 ubiquitin-protein ligase TRIM71-like n=1 Tax=Actinia tenebrosa TaxID=6105 RepID=A0A6P8ILW8_ACTTE|nr:E3 ubiquitin-protein ligase TRIM71-like [Actinia tenebrosa]
MAAVNTYVEDFEKELTCSICHDIFTDPKTLPCLHSYCTQCIAQWYARSGNPFIKQMECPMCKTTIDVPDGDPSKLRSSFYLNSLLPLLHAMKSDANQPILPVCVSCEQPKVLVAFCPQCEGSICEECIKTHESIKQLRDNHQPTMFKDFKQENVANYMNKKIFCKEKFHEDNKLEYFCQEDSCKQSVCQKCATLYHQNHRMQSLEGAALEVKKGLQQDIDGVEGKKEKYEQELKHSEQNKERIGQEIELAKKEVRRAEEMICKTVRDHSTAMISALDQTLQEQTAANDQEQRDINSNIRLLSELQRQWQTLKERGVPYEIIESKEAFQIRSRVLLETPSVLHNKSIQRDITVCYVTSEQFLQSLQNIGKIVKSVTDPARCTIESIKKAPRGFINKCKIITRNTEGEVSPTRIESIDVRIKDGEGNEVEKKVSEEQTGKYRVSYKPQKNGTHEIQVKIGGEPICNSPQKVNILEVTETLKSEKIFGEGNYNGGQLQCPRSMAVSEGEELAIADRGNDRILIFSLDGNYLRVFNDAGLCHPFGAFFNEERIIVSDGTDGEGRIQEFDLNGTYVRTIYKPDQWFAPRGMCVNDNKDIAVCCLGKQELGIKPSIKVFSKQRIDFDMPDNSEQPQYITYGNEKYFVSYLNTYYVRVFDVNGVFLYKFGGKGEGDGQFNGVRGLAVYGPDMILVCDSGNHRVQLFTQEGQFIRSFGSRGTGVGQMTHPVDVVVTAGGRVCVLEWSGNRVQIWS